MQLWQAVDPLPWYHPSTVSQVADAPPLDAPPSLDAPRS
jgi:hypothetical protein